jgi:hypothetical protein
MKPPLAFLLIIACAVASFAFDYRTKTVKVLPVESYPARAELGGVTIAADPYDSDEKAYTAFDVKNLNTRRYYPVHVIIQNSTQTFLNIRTRNVLLITSSGQQLYTTPATVVVEDVIKASWGSKIPKMKSHDQSPSTKAGSPLSDFTTKEMTNRTIDPGTVSDGFLFFFSPDVKSDFLTGSTLYIPKLEEEGNRKSLGPFSIPLDPALKKSAVTSVK